MRENLTNDQESTVVNEPIVVTLGKWLRWIRNSRMYAPEVATRLLGFKVLELERDNVYPTPEMLDMIRELYKLTEEERDVLSAAMLQLRYNIAIMFPDVDITDTVYGELFQQIVEKNCKKSVMVYITFINKYTSLEDIQTPLVCHKPKWINPIEEPDRQLRLSRYFYYLEKISHVTVRKLASTLQCSPKILNRIIKLRPVVIPESFIRNVIETMNISEKSAALLLDAIQAPDSIHMIFGNLKNEFNQVLDGTGLCDEEIANKTDTTLETLHSIREHVDSSNVADMAIILNRLGYKLKIVLDED